MYALVNDQFLAITKCPSTGQSLTLAPTELVERINRAIQGELLRNHLGDVVSEPVDQVLVNKSMTVAYPLRDGIVILLKDESIDLESLKLTPSAEGDGINE